MNEKIKRLANWAQGKKDSPITLELNPTNRCNLKCRSCWQREFEINYDELTTEKLIQVVRQAADLGVKEIRIPGAGEPFMRSDLIEICREIKKNNIYGLLITNGTYLNEKIIKELVEIKWDCLTVSIDSADPETNDYLRGRRGTFKKISDNLKILKIIKDEKPALRFNTVISNRNYDQLDKIIEFAHDVGCTDCQFQPMTVWGDEGKKLEMTDEQRRKFQEHIPKVQNLADKYNVFTNINCLRDDIMVKASDRMDELKVEERKQYNHPYLMLPCFEPWYNMIMLPNGDIAPCSMAGSKGSDSIKGKSLQDVWFGEKFSSIRSRLLEGDLPGYCKRCCAIVHVENDRIKQKLMKIIE